MKNLTGRSITAALTLLIAVGCAVTDENIELWKGTKNGPKKLAAAAVDKDVSIEMRAKAVIALCEISDRDDEDIWDLFIKSFEKMEKANVGKVIEAAVPLLNKKIESGAKGSVSKGQAAAKDALFIMLDFASGPEKKAVQNALIGWCVNDFNIRARAGKYDIRTIIQKIGAPGADALIALLNPKEPTIQYVAELIRDVGDETVIEKASKSLADQIERNLTEVQEVHLIAAAAIGGSAIGLLLLKVAANAQLSPELQRYALRAYSEGINKKSIKADQAHIDALFNIAENSKQDQYQREESYYVIAQAGGKKAAPRVRKLLRNKDSFFRAVGLRCLLRMDGETVIGSVLEELEKSKKVTSKEEVNGIVERIKAFPALLPSVRKLLGSKSAFAAGIAVSVLGDVGVKGDLKLLESLEKDERNLPKGFKHTKLQDAVKTAMDSIKQRG